jgi:hypothetical protein
MAASLSNTTRGVSSGARCLRSCLSVACRQQAMKATKMRFSMRASFLLGCSSCDFSARYDEKRASRMRPDDAARRPRRTNRLPSNNVSPLAAEVGSISGA